MTRQTGAPPPAAAPVPGPPPTVAVVICAYTVDRWDQVRAAVRSVLAQDPAPDEVALVIDHCRQLEELARAAFAGGPVRVLTNQSARGLSGARNTGVASTRSEVIAFLDDDAVAEPGWLAGHAAHYRDPDVLGVGGLVIAAWQDRTPRWFPAEFGWVVGCSYLGQPRSTAAVRNPIGANMSFRRSAIESAGGFASALGRIGATPVGCEETELAIRAVDSHPGGLILHEPAAQVRHQVPAARGTWAYFRRRCWAEGRSKARVRQLSGTRTALATERSYVRRTLPQGVRRNVAEAGRTRDPALLLRATAICAGLAITAAGYCAGRFGPAPDPGRSAIRTTSEV